MACYDSPLMCGVQCISCLWGRPAPAKVRKLAYSPGACSFLTYPQEAYSAVWLPKTGPVLFSLGRR